MELVQAVYFGFTFVTLVRLWAVSYDKCSGFIYHDSKNRLYLCSILSSYVFVKKGESREEVSHTTIPGYKSSIIVFTFTTKFVFGK